MVNATNFNGTTNWFRRQLALTGVIDGSLGLLSYWVKPRVIKTHRILDAVGAGVRVSVDSGASNTPSIGLENTSGSDLVIAFADGPIPIDKWAHVLMSWDVTTADSELFHMVINDVVQATAPSTLTAGTIDYTHADWTLGSGITAPPVNQLDGCLSEFYFNTAEYLDVRDVVERRKFISAQGEPVDLGATGDTPTGTAPAIYLPNAFGTFGTNAGTGGDFTDQGTATACNTIPKLALLSDTLTSGLMAQQTSEGIVTLVTFNHSTLPSPLRFTDNGEDLVSRSETFLAYPFQLDLPDDIVDRPPVAKLRISNVDLSILSSITAIQTPPSMLLEVVRIADPDTVEIAFDNIRLAGFRYDAKVIDAELAIEPVLNEPFPAATITPALFPGSFGSA